MPHIAVIVVPVVDPLLGVRQLAAGADGDLDVDGAKHVLSPYDEAALENALRLRDKSPESTVTALVFGSAVANEALRYVMALKVDAWRWIGLDNAAQWDPHAVARMAADAVERLEQQPSLVLMGPEFGDRDDGLVAPMTARLLGRTYFPMAFAVGQEDGQLVLSRAADDYEERLVTTDAVLATVSTHHSVRLRLPLIKQIMMANRQPVTHEAASTETVPAAVRLTEVEPSNAGRVRGASCRMLEGSASEKAAAFAAIIKEKAST